MKLRSLSYKNRERCIATSLWIAAIGLAVLIAGAAVGSNALFVAGLVGLGGVAPTLVFISGLGNWTLGS
jgi:hypothetical protein